MLNLADAGGRIMYSYKELSELAGYTSRVYNMLSVFTDLAQNKFVPPPSSSTPIYSIQNPQGITEYNDSKIQFINTPIVTPFGDSILINNLSITIEPGHHLMITGPNGAGKSSILRVLAGLWPHYAGRIIRPAPSLSSIMYLPQRPYLTIGTLRDQIIYPHTHADMINAGRTDTDLLSILRTVYLDYIPSREGGLSSTKPWKDVFSGGEKQRIQLARLFYHQPRFAVLDEATSAVSNDVEALVYSSAKDAGMTLVTVSHRPGLFKYHQYLLRVGVTPSPTTSPTTTSSSTSSTSSTQNWILDQINTQSSLTQTLDHELHALESQLQNITTLKQRLKVIHRELGLRDSSDVEKNVKRTLV